MSCCNTEVECSLRYCKTCVEERYVRRVLYSAFIADLDFVDSGTTSTLMPNPGSSSVPFVKDTATVRLASTSPN
jgi:hypothetical protein